MMRKQKSMLLMKRCKPATIGAGAVTDDRLKRLTASSKCSGAPSAATSLNWICSHSPPPLIQPQTSFCLNRQESVAGLLKNMFEGERSEASIVNGTQVLLTLLETRRSGWVLTVRQGLPLNLSRKENSCFNALKICLIESLPVFINSFLYWGLRVAKSDNSIWHKVVGKTSLTFGSIFFV